MRSRNKVILLVTFCYQSPVKLTKFPVLYWNSAILSWQLWTDGHSIFHCSHDKASIYTECIWFCLVCTVRVCTWVNWKPWNFLWADRVVEYCHFSNLNFHCQTYRTQHMFLTHTDNLFCLQLHTVGSWFLSLCTFKVSMWFTLVHVFVLQTYSLSIFYST